MQFEIVIGTELVKVHNPSELFDACDEAGIGIVEATLGMVALEDGLYLRVENTRRIPKPRKTVVKATKADTPEARKARVDSYISWYTPEKIKAEQSIFDN
jgi:hypothetical protein